MSRSDNLREAKRNKNDEFYTLKEDLIAEIGEHEDYIRQFAGKTIYCNCDTEESNFVRYFAENFGRFRLKKLIATHLSRDGEPSYKLEMDGPDAEMKKTPLKGNGDFRSEECIELLKEADIVATNPPFSLFREYIAQLIEYNKEFIIIGNKNAIAYKDVFPLLRDGRLFVGYNAGNGTMHFATEIIDNKHIGPSTHSVPSYWYTNLDLDKTHEPLILTKNYCGNEDLYPKYENYDAIECGRVSDIPKDYFPCWYECPHAGHCRYAETEGKEDKALCEMARNGEIGVPVTYMASHCPEQMQIIGDDTELASPQELENGKYGNGRFYLRKKKLLRLYTRIIIRRKK